MDFVTMNILDSTMLSLCREMGITPDATLIDQILDPTIDFVVGVEAG